MSGFIRSTMVACAIAASLTTSVLAQQAAWPNHPVKIIVPFSAGGTGDIIARSFADYARPVLGQSFIVENRAGAGGNIAATFVARSEPDGYTFLFGSTGPAALNSVMYKKIAFDPLKDFTHVALIGKNPVIFAARQNLPVKSLKELIDYAKANPEKLTAASPGSGTLEHFST